MQLFPHSVPELIAIATCITEGVKSKGQHNFLFVYDLAMMN